MSFNLPASQHYKAEVIFHRGILFFTGQHYFWDVNPNLTPEQFQPWFILYNELGQLHGLGFVMMGNNETQEGKPFYEQVNKLAIQVWDLPLLLLYEDHSA